MAEKKRELHKVHIFHHGLHYHKEKVNVYSLDGKVKKEIVLPSVFEEEFRPDLIKKAVVTSQSNRRQPYGAFKYAGLQHSVEWWGKGRGVSRVPRLMGDATGAQSPGCVGGRRAHPPRPERGWKEKINMKERRKARASALFAVKVQEIVSARGHRFDGELTLPVIVEDKLEELETSKEIIDTLKKLGVYDDLERAKDRIHIRAGRGKLRGRKYREPKSLLVVVSNTEKVGRGLRNIPGVDIATPSTLNTEHLAPGGMPGRLTIFSEKALEHLRKW